MTTITTSVRRLPETPTERIAELERQVADLKHQRMRLHTELGTCISALEAVAPLLDAGMGNNIRKLVAIAREAL